jgi:hypothetical protein
MNREQLVRNFDALTPDQQEQAAEFIAFPRTSSDLPTQRSPRRYGSVADDLFIGIWRDREDMSDSTA